MRMRLAALDPSGNRVLTVAGLMIAGRQDWQQRLGCGIFTIQVSFNRSERFVGSRSPLTGSMCSLTSYHPFGCCYCTMLYGNAGSPGQPLLSHPSNMPYARLKDGCSPSAPVVFFSSQLCLVSMHGTLLPATVTAWYLRGSDWQLACYVALI